MTTPAQPTVPSQEGFILIEVLVSALILAIVAGAVLTLLTATTRSAASQRAHSVAYDLAQENQAQLRTMSIATLSNYTHQEVKPISGTKYTVESHTVFVNNKSQTASCSEGNEKPSYVQLTSTVSAPTMLNPVSIQSVVSPTNGSLAPNVGTLEIRTKNAAEAPLPGVRFTVEGPANHTGVSESTGCANFADMPAGTYTVTSSGGELVNPEGKTTKSEKITVAANEISFLPTVFYDTPGWLEPEFVFLNGFTGKLEPEPVDSMRVYNSAASKSLATTWGTPGGPRLPSTLEPRGLKATPLYPFKSSKYTAFAGSCESDNPDPNGTATANDAAMGFAEVAPGGGARPRVQLPALNLTVRYNGAEVSGAKVTVTDKCTVKRTYTTNKQGHMAASATGAAEGGLPWSTYEVCVSAKLENKYWRFKKSSVAVENLTSGTTLNVDLAKEATVSESESNQC